MWNLCLTIINEDFMSFIMGNRNISSFSFSEFNSIVFKEFSLKTPYLASKTNILSTSLFAVVQIKRFSDIKNNFFPK